MAGDASERGFGEDEQIDATWPPDIAPTATPCSTCQYDLAGLAVEKPEGTVRCPECGLRTWIRKSGEDPSLLHQFDIRCIQEGGASYSVPMVATSLAEASHRVSVEGHTVDPSWSGKEAALNVDHRGTVLATMAAACACLGLCVWQAAVVAAVLAGCAIMASDGTRGRVSMGMAVGLGTLGVLARLIP